MPTAAEVEGTASTHGCSSTLASTAVHREKQAAGEKDKNDQKTSTTHQE
jgi:hypothetical protein